MDKIEDQIAEAYEKAIKDGTLDNVGALILHSDYQFGPLAIVPSYVVQQLQRQIQELQQELDDQKTEESIEWFRRRGLDDSKLLSPEDLEPAMAAWVADSPLLHEVRILQRRAPKQPFGPAGTTPTISGKFRGRASAQSGALRRRHRSTSQGD